jgi:hypothetical protein
LGYFPFFLSLPSLCVIYKVTTLIFILFEREATLRAALSGGGGPMVTATEVCETKR